MAPMRRMITLLSALLILSPAYALRTSDIEVVVPFVTNAPGAFGVTTQTTLHVANRNAAGQFVHLTIYPFFGGTPVTKTLWLGPNTASTIHDVVTTLFGLPNTTGQLIVRAGGNGFIEVRGRYIRTVAATGEVSDEPFLGIGRTHLRKDAYLQGMSGNGGNTVTLGVANPNATTIQVTTRVRSAAGTLLYSRTDAVAAFQNLTFGNIFTAWGIFPQNVQVELTSTGGQPIYGYGMELDDVTIEFEFEWGTSPV